MTQKVQGIQTFSSTVGGAGEPRLFKCPEAYFDDKLAPLEIELENQRHAYDLACDREEREIAIGTCLLLVTLLCYPSIFALFFLLYALSWFGISEDRDKAVDRYNEIYKTKVNPVILNYFNDEFTFSNDCPWTLKNLKSFRILPAFNWEAKTTYVHGTHKTIEIEMLNTKLTNVVRGTMNLYGTTTFSGLLILLTLKKTFFGRTIVTPDKVVDPTLIFAGMRRVHLESPEFDQTFNVYSDDQIEARTLLTLSFMQRLLDLQELINHPVNYSFYSGKLMIPVDREHNYFDLRSFRNPIDIHQYFTAICDHFQIIFELVDILKLDLDIGL